MPLRDMRYLHEIPPDEVQDYGGKAANLCLLQKYGFKVPRGFAISGRYYRQMIDTIPDAKELMKQLDMVDDFEEILELAANLQTIIADAALPSEMVQNLEKMFMDFEGGTASEHGYAVRSSASIEDGNTFSFAGQAETYLCVKSIEEILSSVPRVWRSAISPESAIYLKTKGIRMSGIMMGVVIQEMIDATVSGVLFTANVIDNNRQQMLAESTWGLGEALVGGKVVPDMYIIDRNSLLPLSRTLGSKELTFIQGEGCIMQMDTPQPRREKYTLSDGDLRELAELGTKIEAKMGCPQDIEWALEAGSIVILQSRPITTLRE